VGGAAIPRPSRAPHRTAAMAHVTVDRRLLVEGRKKEGLILVGHVLDVLDEQAKEARRLRWR
jgi:hypothetical protein